MINDVIKCSVRKVVFGRLTLNEYRMLIRIKRWNQNYPRL